MAILECFNSSYHARLAVKGDFKSATCNMSALPEMTLDTHRQQLQVTTTFIITALETQFIGALCIDAYNDSIDVSLGAE